MSTPLPERSLTVSPSLAATIGLDAALLYQLLSEWRQFLSAHEQAGQRWYLIDKQQLSEQLPFWTWAEIEQPLRKLHDLGLLVLGSALTPNSRNFRFALSAETPTAQTERAISQTKSSPARVTQVTQASPRRDALTLGQQQISAQWRPSQGTIDFLKNINQLTDDFIEELVPLFIAHYQESGEAKSSWEAVFMSFAKRRWEKQQRWEIEQNSQRGINKEWQPSRDAWEILLREGISRSFIEDAIPEFILYWGERGTVDSNWNSRFLQHIRLQWSRFKQSVDREDEYTTLPRDWQPSPEVFDILRMACIDANFARDQVREFMLYWRDSGQAQRSWNTKFLQHVKYRWANNHHFGQSDARQQGSTGTSPATTEFIAKHTDRSWAEGL
ncbi:hypothetical protein IB286_03035 [Spongiibacter sp. KMU-158]|uniref:DnaT DNA-binding domain-containing protein n=1 Tax=Spongiibacter pelagi TaxID=2760804 RepID=A0A927C148_9GAMM|nr:DnaT-like ssDNA-binding domain-containing protein [Spongiibacter pelagi]MBD2857967.1 hypothetical protein [Spongiibacter pelagi]